MERPDGRAALEQFGRFWTQLEDPARKPFHIRPVGIAPMGDGMEGNEWLLGIARMREQEDGDAGPTTTWSWSGFVGWLRAQGDRCKSAGRGLRGLPGAIAGLGAQNIQRQWHRLDRLEARNHFAEDD